MLHFELILTTRCNLSCDYCYAQFLEKLDMPFGLIRKLIDNHPLSKLTFTGGEPLLKFELIKKTVNYIKESNKKVSFRLQTNGTIFTKEIIRFIKRNRFEVDISLDGLQDSHDSHRIFIDNKRGSFDVILSNLKLLKSDGVRFSLNYTVNPNTIDGLAGNLLNLVREYTLDVGFVFTEKPIRKQDAERYIYEINKFLDYYLGRKLFLEIDKIYPFESWFTALLFNRSETIKDALNLKCKYHRLRLFPTGEVYPCVASYSLIHDKYKVRCNLGDVERLNYRRLNFLKKNLDLSKWFGDKKLKGCNRVCYLYAQEPSNRFEFEKRIARVAILTMKKYIDNLNPMAKEYFKSIIQKKLRSLQDSA